MTTEEALNQVTDQSDTVNDGAAGGQTIQTEGGSTQTGEGSGLGIEVPPELKEKEKELLRAFHAKTQALADRERQITGESATYKQDAQALYDLSKQEWFKSAIEAEKARRSGAALDISAEDFERIKNDPKEFAAFLSRRDKALRDSLKSEIAPEFQKLGKSQQEILSGRELDNVAAKYGEDFVAANRDKALAPYLEQGFNYETSYKLYCQDNGKIAGKKAVVTQQKDPRSGTVERPGMSAARGGPVYKAKNLGEALDRAFELASKGVTEYRLER